MDNIVNSNINMTHFDCGNENISNMVIRKVKEFMGMSPFNKFYGYDMIEFVELDLQNNYRVYIQNYHKNASIYKYDNEKYTYILQDKNKDYSSPSIPVYFREFPELVNMFKNDYYDYFEIDKMKQLQKKVLNPTIYNSSICNRYIVSPTISPSTNDNLVIIGYNIEKDKWLSNYDFYCHQYLIFDMYNIFCDLVKINKYFIITNSLEVGSLPEVYHFHIYSSKLPIPIMKHVLTNEENGIKFYEIVSKNTANAPSYAFDLETTNVKKLLEIIPKLLYNCRLHKEYKYNAQIFFCMHYDKKYLFITFRRVEIKNIKLIQLPNKKFTYVQAYWDALFISKSKYNISYDPLGILFVNGQANINVKNVLTSNVENDLKSVFHYHPTILDLLKNIIDINKPICPKISDLPENTELKCLDIGRIFKNEEDIVELDCDTLPIIFKHNNKINIQGNLFNHGRINIRGDSYYFIELSDTQIDINAIKYLKELSERYREYDTFPMYYINIINNKNVNILLFHPVKLTLKDFLTFDKDNLSKNSILINTFIIITLHKLHILNQQNLQIPNPRIEEILVTDKKYLLSEYKFFDDLIVTIIPWDIKGNNQFNDKLPKHYKHDIHFSFNTSLQNETIENNIKIFINSLYSECVKLNIKNLLLIGLHNIIQKPFFSARECFNLLYFAMDVHNYKAPMWEILTLIGINSKLVTNTNIDYTNLYTKIIKSINTSNKPKYDYELIKKDTVFITGTGYKNSDSVPIDIAYGEIQHNRTINPAWFSTLDDLTYDSKYLTTLFDTYMKTNNTSRLMMYSVKDDVKILKISDGIGVSDLINKLCNDIKNLYPDIEKSFPHGDELSIHNVIKFINNGADIFPNLKKYNSSKWNIMNMLQNLSNFAMAVKGENGCSCYIDEAELKEYVFFNTHTNLKLLGIVVMSYDRIDLITDFKTYLNYMNQNNKFKDYSDDKMSIVENFMKLKNVLVDQCNNLTKSKFDFYTRPSEGIYNLYLNQNGGMDKKYKLVTNDKKN